MPSLHHTTNSRALTTAKGSHLGILRVHLVDVGHASAEVVDGHVVAVAVPEVVGLMLRHQYLIPAVALHAGHDAPDAWGELVHMCHRRGIQQLVLSNII